MAQQALPAGRATTRGRALFGLLDREGWGWASVKAVFWFIAIIFLLGYIPDRAYYFMVNRTIDLGILAWSPINLCPPSNESLPCPPPVGAAIPWEVAPPEISLPKPRTDGSVIQSGTQMLFIGGSDGSKPADTVFVTTTSGPGNFDKWRDGPKLPEARADGAAAFSGGSIFYAGGIGPDGKPTKTTYIIIDDRPERRSWASGRRRRRPASPSTCRSRSPGRCSCRSPTGCCSSAGRPTGRRR